MNRDFDMQLTLDRERKWTCEKTNKKSLNYDLKVPMRCLIEPEKLLVVLEKEPFRAKTTF